MVGCIVQGVLKKWSDDLRLRLILTTGGTGFAESDVTPEVCVCTCVRACVRLCMCVCSSGIYVYIYSSHLV